MGFPSPAADYTEKPLSLDALCIHKPHATYFMRAGQAYLRAGIQKGATLVVDASVKPCDGSIVIVALGGEFVVKRLRLHPAPALLPLDYTGTPVPIDLDDITFSFMSEDSLKESIGYIFLLFCGSLYLTLTGLCPIVMNIFKKLFKTLRVQK
ncbi:S24 family peptidase [Serratia marcescens]|uniref:HumD family translesion DNA polymerase n=1 Tax=Serratia marcescens TaxID=615 RepID=UPI001F1544A8|nr:S24 family peptidase [Serratia marcescens]